MIDTNVLVSGLLSPDGPPGRVLNAWLDGHAELLTSHAQLVELARVLAYPPIAERLPADDTAALLANMRVATLIDPAGDVDLSDDPDDNAILALAIAGSADLMVSGDKRHMLRLQTAERIPIVTARAAVTRMLPPKQADTE